MPKSELKEKIAKGLFWGGISNGLQQIVSVLFGIALARILNPGDYGTIGMLAIFSSLASTLQESGFTNALINRKAVENEDYNSVFWFNIVVSIGLYLVLFFSVPYIAEFYQMPVLVPLSRIVFLCFVISSAGISANALLCKKMMVKERGLATLISMVISNTIGVTLASKGLGVWGMAIQSLSYSTLSTASLVALSGFKPYFHFKIKPISEMFGFSVKLMITNAFEVINYNIFSVVFGRLYSEKEVGYYSQGNKWNTMGYSIISGMTSIIAQPLFSELSKDNDRKIRAFRKMIRFCSFASFPVMFGMALIAPEFITVLLKEKWSQSADILRILCIQGAFQPIISQYLYLVLSHGKSSVRMWLSISLGLLQLAIAILLHPLGMRVMIVAYTIINILWIFLWQYYAHKLIGYSIVMMIRDIGPFIVISAVCMMTAYLASLVFSNILSILLCKIVVSVIAYIAVCALFNISIFNECITYVKERYHIHIFRQR